MIRERIDDRRNNCDIVRLKGIFYLRFSLSFYLVTLCPLGPKSRWPSRRGSGMDRRTGRHLTVRTYVDHTKGPASNWWLQEEPRTPGDICGEGVGPRVKRGMSHRQVYPRADGQSNPRRVAVLVLGWQRVSWVRTHRRVGTHRSPYQDPLESQFRASSVSFLLEFLSSILCPSVVREEGDGDGGRIHYKVHYVVLKHPLDLKEVLLVSVNESCRVRGVWSTHNRH